MRDVNLTIQGDVQRLRLQPGDRILVKCHEVLSPESHRQIRETIESQFPGVPCLVVTGGLDVSVIGPGDGA